MKDAQGKETENRILELEQRIAMLEKKISSMEVKQVTMADIEEDMAIKHIAREFARGNKEPLKEHNRNYKLLHPDSKKRSSP